MAPTNMKEYMLSRHHRRMAEAKEALGGVCSECGSTDQLQFHHTDPDTKSFTIGKQAAGVSEKRFRAELEKCVLLCKSCHTELHKTHEHGTITMYNNHKCRCEECREIARQYRRRRLGV